MESLPYLLIGLIHAFRRDNVSRSLDLFKDDKDFASVVRILIPGWNVSQGVMGIYPYTEEAKKEALREREEARAILEQSQKEYSLTADDGKKATIGGGDVLRSWDQLFTKKGKIMIPSHGVVYAHRRWNVYPVVQAFRAKMGLDIQQDIPCEIITGNEQARYERCLLENAKKKDGTRPVTFVDNLHGAYKMRSLGCSQSDLRRVWNHGTGQKLWRLLDLNAKFPDLKIMDKACAGTFNVEQTDKERLQTLLNGKTDKDTGVVLAKAADEAQVLEYLSNPKADNGNAAKIASKEKIANLSKHSPVILIKDTASAIAANDLAALAKYTDVAPDLNLATNAIMVANAKERAEIREFLGHFVKQEVAKA